MNNKIFFTAFICFWIVLILLNFVLPSKTFSESENRMLASFPRFSFANIANGEFINNLDDYINDHFVFRDIWLKIKSSNELLLGKTENNGVYIGNDGYLFEKIKYTEESEKNINELVDTINDLQEKTNIPTYFLLIPTSIYIYEEKLPKFVETFDQEEVINNAYSKTKDVVTINTVNTLKNNKDKYIYFKTDHHMTSDGAYLVYLEFCNAVGIEPITEYQKEEVTSSFLGTFDSKAQIINQKKDYIISYKNYNNTEGIVEVNYDKETTNSIFNENYLKTKDKYSYFLNGNNANVVIKTKNNNGRKLLVIKDSYAHIMAQFLCQNYEEVHFIDPRYYNLSIEKYIQDNQITETLFLYNVSNVINL